MLNTTFKLFFSVCVLLLSVACASPRFQMKDVKALAPGQAVVFGRFDGVQIEKGKPKKLQRPRILILQSGSKIAKTYQVRGDGFFCWGLEPGDYTILNFLIGRVWGGRIGARFTVSEEAKSAYIGNLKVEVKEGRSWYKVSIKDYFPAGLESFKNRFPNAQEPVKSLMLPREEIGSYQRMRYVCADEWGIKCDKLHYSGVGFMRYVGVEPINPKVSTKEFQQIDNLLPTFEWKPSSRDDITYDLVVHEAVAYSISGVETDIKYAVGRVVAYEENIKEAKFCLKYPLHPDSKYFWSVRLRRDDVVSNWSTFSYFATAIIASFSGGGKWFTFATPSK